jgi:hypothetical protein
MPHRMLAPFSVVGSDYRHPGALSVYTGKQGGDGVPRTYAKVRQKSTTPPTEWRPLMGPGQR